MEPSLLCIYYLNICLNKETSTSLIITDILFLCLLALYIEYKFFHKKKNADKLGLKHVFLCKPIEHKFTAEEFIQVDRYVRKYYRANLLLEFVQYYESSKNESVSIDAILNFIDNPKYAYKAYINA